MTSGAFMKRVSWESNEGTIELNDVLKIDINKSTEIKNNICTITVKNPVTKTADDGSIIGTYVDPTTKTILFQEEDEVQVWAQFTNDPSEVENLSWYDADNNLGYFLVEEFETRVSVNSTQMTIKCIDTAYHLFNKVYTFSYGVSNIFTVPGIIRQICRKHTEANSNNKTTYLGTQNDPGTLYLMNSKFVSEGGFIEDIRRVRTSTDPDTYSYDATTNLNGSISNSDTTINVDSTSGFEDSGTLVIDAEHIYYTGTTGTSFTNCTREIDDTTAVSHSDNVNVYQGFPSILLSKIWKPLFEWIGEISQTENTNYLSEVQIGGTRYFNRAFMFWVDEDQAPHFFYPDDNPDLSIDLGEEGRRSFKLGKSVFDAVNFIVYNCGEDMYGNGIIHYWYDTESTVGSLKMRYQPMSKIIHTLLDDDLKANPDRDTTNQDIYKQFPDAGDYPLVPSFLDLSNQFRVSELGLSERTDVTNDADYNDALREACKQQGLVEAKKITLSRTGLRYKGDIVLKGAHVNPGDLVTVNNRFGGQSDQLLRVLNVRHRISNTSWETSLGVEEDESREA